MEQKRHQEHGGWNKDEGREFVNFSNKNVQANSFLICQHTDGIPRPKLTELKNPS